MGNARITQGPSLLLAGYDPGAEVTQTALLALVEFSAISEITQGLVLVLAEFLADQRVSQAAVLCLAAVAPCATSDAQCWRVEREDGIVLGFTTHDQPITYNGLVYTPCASLAASAVSSSVFGGASTGDIQAKGLIDDDAISAADLYAGRYDNAAVIVSMVDWQTGAGRPLTRGIVSKTDQGLTQYSLTAMTGGARLQQQPLLDVYAPLCSAEFGDARCGFDVEALRITSVVTASAAKNVVTQAPRRTFFDAAMIVSGAESYNNGRLTWTSGANIGLTFEVKSVADGVVTLWMPTAVDIEAGDQYSLVPGCDKTQTTCSEVYVNLINFRGYPDVPGTDALNQTPNQ